MGTTLQYLTFEQVGMTLATITIALTFIVLVFNASKGFSEWRGRMRKATNDKFEEQDKVIQNHEERIGHLEDCCEEVHGKLENDYEFQKNAAETNKLILKSIKQLLKYSLDGKEDGLQVMEDAIDNYLVEHQK